MLSYLQFSEDLFGPLRLFQFISVRSIMAGITALFIGFWAGPRVIGFLQNLIHLNLESNFLKQLPASLKNLQHLKTLDISNNPLTSLPKGITAISLKPDQWDALSKSIVHRLFSYHQNSAIFFRHFEYQLLIKWVE